MDKDERIAELEKRLNTNNEALRLSYEGNVKTDTARMYAEARWDTLQARIDAAKRFCCGSELPARLDENINDDKELAYAQGVEDAATDILKILTPSPTRTLY